MSKRSAKPSGIKCGKKHSTYNPKKPSDKQPMNFKKGLARKPRPDTGKKLTKSHNNRLKIPL